MLGKDLEQGCSENLGHALSSHRAQNAHSQNSPILHPYNVCGRHITLSEDSASRFLIFYEPYT